MSNKEECRVVPNDTDDCNDDVCALFSSPKNLENDRQTRFLCFKSTLRLIKFSSLQSCSFSNVDWWLFQIFLPVCFTQDTKNKKTKSGERNVSKIYSHTTNFSFDSTSVSHDFLVVINAYFVFILFYFSTP